MPTGLVRFGSLLGYTFDTMPWRFRELEENGSFYADLSKRSATRSIMIADEL
jgi:hypothetical protein